MKWVAFLTVNHRRPPLFRELHSTDETIVWRDPGGSEPVYDLFTITSDFSLPEAVRDTDMLGLCQFTLPESGTQTCRVFVNSPCQNL